MIKINCSNCNKEILRRPYRLKQSKNHFCNQKCYGQWKQGQVPWNKNKKGLQVAWNKDKKCPQIAIKLIGNKNGVGHIVTDEHKKQIKEANTGEKNGNWRGGTSFLPYPIKFNKELKERIHQRDDYVCQLCEKTKDEELEDFGKKLAVHHVDYNKENCEEINLITLCNKCNSIVNFDRDDWIKCFQNKLALVEVEICQN